jgi:hypothetical protein
MGVIRQGILGGFSGTVANVVGSSWKGIAVIKSRPLSVANPNTAAQQAQRNRMTGIVAQSRILLAALISPYWNPFAQKMSGYNMFVKENIDTFVGATFTVYNAWFSTRGSLLGVPAFALSAVAAADTVTFTWTDNSGTADALATDEAIGVVYNETQDYYLVDAGSATRDAGTLVIADTSVVASDDLHGYLSFSRPNVSKVSDSVYDDAAAG